MKAPPTEAPPRLELSGRILSSFPTRKVEPQVKLRSISSRCSCVRTVDGVQNMSDALQVASREDQTIHSHHQRLL